MTFVRFFVLQDKRLLAKHAFALKVQKPRAEIAAYHFAARNCVLRELIANIVLVNHYTIVPFLERIAHLVARTHRAQRKRVFPLGKQVLRGLCAAFSICFDCRDELAFFVTFAVYGNRIFASIFYLKFSARKTCRAKWVFIAFFIENARANLCSLEALRLSLRAGVWIDRNQRI